MTTQSMAARIVAGVHAGERLELGKRPLAALRHLGFTVAAVATPPGSRGAQGWCDGMSFTTGQGIVYRQTDNRRENFTLLHEYAHGLVDKDEEALERLADLEDTPRELERLCDAIAAELLLPTSAVDAVVKAGPVRADHAVALFDTTRASHHAIAVRLVARLSCAGSVFLVNANTLTVAFAATSSDLQVWPGKNQPVPAGHVLRRLQPEEPVTTPSFWTTPWGKRQSFYVDARRRTNWTHVVLAERDIWKTETFHARDDDRELPRERQARTVSCPCGYHGTTAGAVCDEAEHPYCPKCQEYLCHYGTRNQVRCSSCYLVVPASDVQDGRCSICG
jgi:hypothetical protein